MGYYLVLPHHLRVSSLNGRIVFVLIIHFLTHVGTHCSQTQAVQDVHHVGIVFVIVCVKTDNLLVSPIAFSLVENAQNLVQPVVYLAVKQRNLHDDTVVYQTVDERVGHAVLHFFAVVVECLVTYVHHRFLYVAHAVPQKIDGYHRQCVALVAAFLLHVLFCVILCGKIAAEAESFCVQPCLLKFYQNQMHRTVVFPHPCRKINAKHRQVVARHIRMFMTAHLNAHHLFLQQGGKHSDSNAFVFHKELEHRVVYRIGHRIFHIFSSTLFLLPANLDKISEL